MSFPLCIFVFLNTIYAINALGWVEILILKSWLHKYDLLKQRIIFYLYLAKRSLIHRHICFFLDISIFRVFIVKPCIRLYHVLLIWNALTHEGKIIDIREYSCWQRVLYSCKVCRIIHKRGGILQTLPYRVMEM